MLAGCAIKYGLCFEVDVWAPIKYRLGLVASREVVDRQSRPNVSLKPKSLQSTGIPLPSRSLLQ